MKIGIFSGTFDPFHAGHYEIVKKVLADKLVDKVVVLPSIVRYYRSEKDALFSDISKKKILNKWFDSTDDFENVILDFHEYDLMQSYSINKCFINDRRYFDMLCYAKTHYSSKYSYSNIEFYTILGEDSYKNFTTWYNWNEILKMSKLIVIGRSDGIIVDGVSRDYEEIVPTAYYRYIDKKFANVSASKIRNRLINNISNMSFDSNGTCLNSYLDEIEDYKKFGTIYEENEEYLEKLANKIKKDADKFINDFKTSNEVNLNSYTSLNSKNTEKTYDEVVNDFVSRQCNECKKEMKREFEEKLDKDYSFKHSDLEYESLRDKALDMARTLDLIEKEAHECAMCGARDDNGYSADEFLKRVCYLLFQSQGYHREEF